MARTREGALLTERHRLLQVRLSATTLHDLLRLWGTVDPTDLKGTIGPFTTAGAIAVRAGRRASAAAASRYYSLFRQVEGVRGQVLITLAPPPPDGVVAGAIRGAGLAGIQRARARGATVEQAHRNGYVKLAGSAAGLVLGGGRDTLSAAIRSDDEAHGWQRVTDGSPCAFCAMIAGRGIVSKEEAGAGFEAHGHCGCTAEPAFEGSSVSRANEGYGQAWQDATNGLSGGEALNAFRRHLAGPQ